MPPLKITLNGIMDILGRPQALFKVLPEGFSNGQARRKFYILGEGQRQDDIEVLHIDMKTGRVVFENHGMIQSIILANTSTLSTLPSGEPLTPAQILFRMQYQ